YVGRLSPEKDVANAIDSMGKFVFPQTQVHLCIVGDGPERKFLEWKVQDLGIEDRVHFLGFRRDIPNILSSLDLLVLSSLRELFPMVALEALYYECPVVATRIGGVPEVVIDGETGFTAPPGDSEKLGEAILKILDEPDKARKMGQKGRQKVLENFSLEKVGQELLETFLQFIQ
ncbi:MAG: glycosyltransferase family 1 protein, partial [Planctomycetota bacterium]